MLVNFLGERSWSQKGKQITTRHCLKVSWQVAPDCNTGTLEAEAGGLLWVQGYLRLHSEILSQDMIKKSVKENA